ncbi:MAG: dihydroorotate dehydrogenase electron transfer subunit [Bacteroidaceae bacterium]
MKKYILDLTIKSVETLHEGYVLLRLTDETAKLPDMIPGQFAEVRVDNSSTTFLRRPISINYVDKEKNELWLLIHIIGEGTRALSLLKEDGKLNLVFPLGNGFSIPENKATTPLLIGGGVGIAPMLYMGKVLKDMGIEPTFLLGARSAADLLQLDDFNELGCVAITTEDGSMGEKGFVTQHSLLSNKKITNIYTCGPKPMMMAVAQYAKKNNIACEVSLENMMACGLGACLCCVEKTVKGNVCVCKEGPVFNIKDLTWQI